MKYSSLLTTQILIFIVFSLFFQHSILGQSTLRQSNLKKIQQLDKSIILESKGTYTIAFHSKPTPNQIKELKAKGIQIIQTDGNTVFEVSLSKGTSPSVLSSLGIDKLATNDKDWKISPYLLDATKGNIAVTFRVGTSAADKESILEEFGFTETDSPLMGGRTLIGRINPNIIKSLAAMQAVEFIDLAQGDDLPLVYENRSVQKANVLNNNTIKGGRNLNGKGVVVGIGDGGELGDHLDFDGRTINFASGTYSAYGEHGDHVVGILGAGGIVDERHRGIASESTLLIHKTSRIITYAETYYKNNGMVLTSNSYGSGATCNSYGEYNYTSQNLDLQMRAMPELLHVFAAGNSGAADCVDYPVGYSTILRSYASAKNVLTVGAVDENKNISSYSSRGPAKDGRIKPEIMAVGENVHSTNRDYGYTPFGATSAATPSVTGTLALLVERYRQLNQGANPKGGLIKAIATNTAEDKGNTAVDYLYGFGVINAKRAVEVIEEGAFFEGSIKENQKQTKTIEVTEGLEELKVMLYWHDKEAQPYATTALVNDLDIELIAPDGSVVLPWSLDTTKANVNLPATRKIDRVNNIEQITIKNPIEGTYTIRVKGYSLPLSDTNDQEYFVTYDLVETNLELTHPVGGEVFEPGATEMIVWESTDKDGGNFNIEYRIEGGTWKTISNNVDASLSEVLWTVPNTLAGVKIEVRVSQTVNELQSTTGAAVIIYERPVLSLTADCANKVQLDWTALDYTNKYEIYQFINNELALIGETTQNAFLLDAALNSNEEYWFAIKAYALDGSSSLRSMAKRVTTDPSECFVDFDLSLEEVTVNKLGRENAPSSLSDNENITLLISNNTNTVSKNIEAFFSINGNIVTETIASIAPESVLEFTFDQKADFSSAGFYDLNAWIASEADTNTANDSIIAEIRIEQIANPEAILPINNVFNGVLDGAYYGTDISISDDGVLGFENISNGEMTISSSAESGKILSIASTNAQSSADNSIILTFNLSNYTENKILLDFEYFNEIYKGTSDLETVSTDKSSGLNLYARGAENEEWVFIKLINVRTDWTLEEGIDIVNPILESGQQISASFQIKFNLNSSNSFHLRNFSLYDGGLLPVELSSFTAIKINDSDVQLKWTTESEINNDYFEVQVAKGASAFANSDFVAVEEVNGAGSTSEKQSYTTIHSSDYRLGTYYYRLKQIDFDGAFAYSEVVAVDFDGLISMNVYPNPISHSRMNVDLSTDKSGEVIVELIQLDGRIARSYTRPVVRGDQTLHFDLSGSLADGSYFLRITSGDSVKVQKIIKRRR